MKKNQILVASLLLSISCASYAQTTQLSPNSNNGGVLPNGYRQIDFSLRNGDWAPSVTLPDKPRDGDKVSVLTTASFAVRLNTQPTDLHANQIELVRNKHYHLQYVASTKTWALTGDTVQHLTPNDIKGGNIPGVSAPITYFTLSDGNWARQVSLPAGVDGNLMVVRSFASLPSGISGSHLLYPSTSELRRADSYTYAYKKDLDAWLLVSAPVRHLYANDIRSGVPSPTTPRTLVEVNDRDGPVLIQLPAVAGDRDRITVRSHAELQSAIDTANVAFNGSMLLIGGDEYQFMYLAQKRQWELIKSPQATFQAWPFADRNLLDMTHPLSVVHFSDGNWIPTLKLPIRRRSGDRVIVKTSAARPFTVDTGKQSFPVTRGETVAFVASSDGEWQKETKTIDLLMLYSDKAASQLGENVMQARLKEGLDLTNDALENSRANFRFRAVDNRKVNAKPHWTALNHPLRELREDPEVQDWRNRLKADGIYYEGNEEGCGLAFVRSSAFNMVATGSTNCGTTVMRHELGHSMGLDHSAGHTVSGTIMNGNTLPFFATPLKYHPEDGRPLTPADGRDEVGIMNTHAVNVVNYR